MSSLYNRARVNTATAGTGTMTLGAATSNAFFTFAEAGVPDGAVVSYVIEDGSNVELGVGTYTLSGTTLSRTVTASKISGTAGTTKLTLSGSAIVYIDALAADITVPPASSTDKAIATYSGTTGRAIQDNPTVAISSTGQFAAVSSVVGDVQHTFQNSDTGASTCQLAVVCGTSANFRVIANGQFGLNAFYLTAGEGLFQTATAAPWRWLTNNVEWMRIQATGEVGIGTLTPDRFFHVEHDFSATNTVSYYRVTVTSSGTPAAGIGVGWEFEVEAQVGVNKVGGTIENYAYNVGAGTEGFETVFKTMSAGAAATEKGRTGFMPVNMIQNDSLTLRASNSMVVSSQYTIPASVNLTMSADSVMRIL